MRSERGRWLALVVAVALPLLGCGGSGGDGTAVVAEGPGAAPDGADSPASAGVPADDAAALTGLRLSFRIDPRLTTGLYMGERWVSPRKFTMLQEGGELVVHARAHAVDGAYESDVSATWTAAAPEMVSAAPERGHQVALTVVRAGTTQLTVTSGESSRTATISATHDAGVWRVEIAQ